jgi:hypothetical protein
MKWFQTGASGDPGLAFLFLVALGICVIIAEVFIVTMAITGIGALVATLLGWLAGHVG